MAWPTTVWTDQLRETVRKMWGKGYTASEIAGHLDIGVTRNAIIGLVHRRGWVQPPRLKGQPPRKRPLPRKVRPMDSHVPSVPPPPQPQPVLVGQLTIMDLRDHHCRWPGEDRPFTYCGRTVQFGSSYCQQHHKRAHHP
jgi:GcrA cell cycle regulator